MLTKVRHKKTNSPSPFPEKVLLTKTAVVKASEPSRTQRETFKSWEREDIRVSENADVVNQQIKTSSASEYTDNCYEVRA